MFGLTKRVSDGNRYLMGQAVLHVHTYDGREYQPEGYWCSRQEDDDGIPLPIAREAELEGFSREWRLSRGREAGTSVVSPYIPDELKAERLLQAVAVHFFVRILRGEMEVEVVGTGMGSKTLNQKTIEAICKDIEWDGSKRTKRHAAPPIAFVKGCLESEPTIITDVLGKGRVPATIEPSAIQPAILEAVRSAFAAGVRVAIRVRLHLPRKQGPDKEGHLDAYLERTPDGEKCDSYFVREGMTITKINSRAGSRGIRAFVIVDKGPLGELLGDTEGPAHEDWDTSAERPDRTWKVWKGRVTFVRKIVDHLVELLTPLTTEPDFNLLSDFFSLEHALGPQKKRSPGEEKKDRPTFDFPSVAPKWYQISERSGGFTVSHNAHVAMPAATALRVSLAYDLPQGDPVKKWNKLDFVIDTKPGNIALSGKGVHFRSLEGNVFVLSRLEPAFHLKLDGFDRNRDLYVRVDEDDRSEDVQA